MQQRDRHRALHVVGQLVHGVGADQQAAGAAVLQRACDVREYLTGFVPASLLLQVDNVIEVDRPHQNFSGVKPAQSAAHLLIESAIVNSGTFPTHSTDQANRLHFLLLASRMTLLPCEDDSSRIAQSGCVSAP